MNKLTEHNEYYKSETHQPTDGFTESMAEFSTEILQSVTEIVKVGLGFEKVFVLLSQ